MDEVAKAMATILRFARESGAGQMKWTHRKVDNTPTAIVFVVTGDDAVRALPWIETIEKALKPSDEDLQNVPGIHEVKIGLDFQKGTTEVEVDGNLSKRDVTELLGGGE